MIPDFRAWAEVDLDAFRHNLRTVRRAAGAARVWPVLKGNAYGHGAQRVAQVCDEEGVDRIGVGDSGEALELREAGVRAPLLILGTVIDAEVPHLFAFDIEVGVHTTSRVRKLAESARFAGRRLGVHLNVDTGMSRLGVRPEAALRVAQAVAESPFLDLRGLMTHFSAAPGCRDPFTAHQHALFLSVVQEVRDSGIPVPSVHCANSAALFTGLKPLGDAVRSGIALYGAMPDAVPAAGLRPVLSVRAQVVFLKDVPEGTPVGYGGRWRSRRPTRLATLPIGYCDGVPYRLGAGLGTGGGGTILLRGRRCPLVGAVSMDYCVADVGHVPGVKVGDTATLIGSDGSETIRVQDVAAEVGTIPYEITCSLGPRVRRVFQEGPRRLSPALVAE